MAARIRGSFLTAIALLLLFGSLAWSQQGTEELVDFRINPSVSYQTMSGFGAGICETTIKDMQGLSDQDRERLYDLVYGQSGVRLNIIRFHVSWTAQPLGAEDPLRKSGIRYDWEHDVNTQNVIQAIRPALRRGSPILYAVPFTPPPRWKSNRQPTWGGRLLPENYPAYAEYLADFVAYYRKRHGLNVDVLSLQNEPDVAVWWESCRWTGEELAKFLKVLVPLFRERGFTTKFMVSEGSTWDQAWIKVAPILEDPEARGLFGVLASHSYGGDDLVDRGRDFFRAASARFKIPIWMSEMSLIGLPDDPSMNSALRIAHLIYRDLVQGGASAWIYCFVIFNPDFPGSMGILSPVSKKKDLLVPKRFWALAHYSHFIRPGWKRIEVEGLGCANSAFISPQGDRLAIVALNAGVNARPIRYSFGKWGIDSVEVYRTTSESDFTSTKVGTGALSRFSITLEPRSVTTIVARLINPAPRRQPAPRVQVYQLPGTNDQ